MNGPRPKLLLLVSHGWNVRNYLRSEFLSLVGRLADVTVLLTPGAGGLERELRREGVRVEPLDECPLPHRFTALNGFLNAACNRRLGFWNQYLWSWSVNLDSPLKRPYYELQRAASKLLGRSPFYELLTSANERMLGSLRLERMYERLFEEVEPDVLFSTNPYSLQELPVTLLAKARGVPTVGAVISWDNLSYKGPLPVAHDHYAVWSRTMREELLRHMPRLAPERVNITGTPQFDFHLLPELEWEREEFFFRVGGDPRRRLLTYGGSVETLFPDELEFVARLWRAIEDGEIADRPQLLLRLHPHDNKERFDSLRERCPGILISRPWEYDAQRFWWFTPSVEQLALLSNTIRHSDVGLNVASSLTLDFAVLDKPVVNIGFSGIDGNHASHYVADCYRSHHYGHVLRSGAVPVARSFGEALSHVNRYLEDPAAGCGARARLVEEICGPVDGMACRRVARLVATALGRKFPAEEEVLACA